MPINHEPDDVNYDLELDDAMRQDNADMFMLHIARLPDSEQQKKVIDSLYPVTLHGYIRILNRLLTSHIVLNYLATDEHATYLLDTAIKSHNVDIFDLYLEIPRFRDFLQENLREHFAEAAKVSFAIFKKIIDLCGIGDNLDAWGNLAFKYAHCNFNTEVANYLLHNPNIFEFAVSHYNNQPLFSGNRVSDFIFDHYFPALKERIKHLKPQEGFNLDLDTQEANLGYLVLRYLISTYSLRKRLKLREKTKFEYERRRKDTSIGKLNIGLQYGYQNFKSLLQSSESKNTQLKMIKMLLSIPVIRDLAAKDDNQLLRLAIRLSGYGYLSGVEYADIISLLRAVKSVSDNEIIRPIDLQYEMNNPIDLLAEYNKKHPSVNTLAYEYSVKIPGFSTQVYLNWGVEEFNRLHPLKCVGDYEEEDGVDFPISRTPRFAIN